MLVQFTVENFMSFEKETTFSMAASPDDAHPDHVCQPETNEKGGPLLRAAALYGANASGKSNLIKAIAFARNLIVEGTRFGERLYPQPFRLSDAREKPSRFQFIFRTGGVLYEYGFVLDNERIHEEWLIGTENTPRAKEKKYFERTTDADGKTKVEIGPKLKAFAAGDSQRLHFVAEGTRPNQLFLCELLERNFHIVGFVMRWFLTLYIIAPDEVSEIGPDYLIYPSDMQKQNSLRLLQAAGAGIEEVTERLIPVDVDKEYPNMSEFYRRTLKLTSEVQRASIVKNTYSHLYAGEMNTSPFTVDKDGNICRIEVNFVRRGKDGLKEIFDLTDESDGTKRFLFLLSYLELYSDGQDAVVLVDELDRRLHTLLSRTFLQVALSGANRKNQLIFTTHDTNLLDLDLLRRDEIWFVEKDNGGASHLYSLADFKIRPDLKVEKGYLNGRFGAIPYIGDISKLGFAEPNKADAETAALEE